MKKNIYQLDYHKKYSQELIARKHLISFIEENINYKNKVILDAGCNGGFLSFYLAKNGAKKVYGIDLSPGFISKNILNAKKEKMSNKLEFKVGDVQELPFKDNMFDLIISSEVIEHVNNPKLVVREFERVSKVGGEVLVTTPNILNPAEILHNLKHFILYFLKGEEITHIRHFTFNSLRKLFIGFKIIHLNGVGMGAGFFKFNNNPFIKKVDIVLGKILQPISFDMYIVAQKKKSEDPVGHETLEAMSKLGWYNKLIYQKFIEPYLGDKTLEIGSGIGNFTTMIMKKSKFVVASDVKRDYLLKLKKKFGSKIKVSYGDIELGKFKPNDNKKFDSIVCLNVLEHINNDIKALENMYSKLNKRGKLILLVPAHMQFFSLMDENLGHFRRYNKNDLALKMKKVGFKIKAINYFNMFSGIGWFISGKILQNDKISVNLTRLVTVFIRPLLFIENYFNIPFGLSVVVIAERK